MHMYIKTLTDFFIEGLTTVPSTKMVDALAS